MWAETLQAFDQGENRFFTTLALNGWMTIFLLSLLTYLSFNLFVFLIYWWDKEAARNNEWRIRESTLLWLAFLGGSAGAVVAQRVLRHKTRKEPFRSNLIAIIILQIGLAISLFIMPDWPAKLLAIADTLVQKSGP